MSDPLVSVVMSAYNEEKYVCAAVDSILTQTYRHLELIVVDDGSTDDTARILGAVTDPRLRLIRQENAGQAAGRNAGIAAAEGIFITFMDADDLCDAARIEKQVRYLLENGDLHGVGTWETIVDHAGRTLESTSLPCDPADIRAEYAAGRMGLNGMSVMVRSEVLRAVHGFRSPLRSAEDFDLWLRVTERYDIACLPDHLYYYRQHPRASSHARKQEQRFYRHLAIELQEERRATGTDRLERGEVINIPQFEEESGTSSYRRSIAWYHCKRSGELAKAGRWGQAVRFALKGWWTFPIGRQPTVVLCKTLIGAVFPFTRPHLDTMRTWVAGALKRGSDAAQPTGRGAAAAAAAPGRETDPIAAHTAPLETTLIRRETELTAVAEEWDALLAESDTPSSFFLSSTSLLPFWKAYSARRELAVVLARDVDGRLVGVAPFYVETVGRRLSRHRRLALLGSPESGADYLDVIARPGYREAVLRESLRCYTDSDVRWSTINLDYVLDDSETIALLSGGRSGTRFRLHVKPSSECPYATLAPTWEEHTATLGSSTRRGMKYQLNLLRRKFQEVRFDLCEDEARIREMLDLLIRYKQARYGHRFDHDYVAWPEQAVLALRKGHLRFWVLHLDGHPACLWLTFLFARRVFFQACSYDPQYANLRLGKVMMAHAVRAAIEEGAVEYDMKRGTADYKQHWSNGRRRTVQVNAVRRGLRGAWISFWEYGASMESLRRGLRSGYTKAQRAARILVTPVARHFPVAVPKRLRERVLRHDGGPDASDSLVAESG